MMVQIACLAIICTFGTVIAGTSNYPFVKFVGGNQKPPPSSINHQQQQQKFQPSINYQQQQQQQQKLQSSINYQQQQKLQSSINYQQQQKLQSSINHQQQQKLQSSINNQQQRLQSSNNRQEEQKRFAKSANGRPARSFDLPDEYFAFADVENWPETIFLDHDQNFFDFTLGYSGNTHYSPDYSNGLLYPDPYLLRGNAARRAVAYIYGKGELFFNNIPHQRAVLKLQQQRSQNGLAPNRLGSLNNRSPFFRL